MGYATAIGRCFVCGRVFSFNPISVPSYKGEPICKICIELINERRRTDGLPQWPIMENAYTYCNEEEL